MVKVKVNLTAMNEKLNRNEKQLQRNELSLKDVKAVEQNLVAKVELVQEQLNKQEVNNRHIQGDIVGMKKSLNEITKQLERFTQQTLHEVQAEQEEMKKGIAEADEVDTEPKVVIAGGRNRNGRLNSVEMFNLSTRTWTPLQPMRECRCGASSVVYNNMVVVTGGLGDTRTTESMERLPTNAQTDQSISWEKLLAQLPGRLHGHCSVVYNGRLIVIGGRDGDKGGCSDSIAEISLVPPFTTKLLATMPQRRCGHGVAVFGDKIVIVGGRDHPLSREGLRSVIMYDITKNECKKLAPIPYPVSDMATVKWGDDNVIMISGAGRDYESLSKVLIYNVNTQKSHFLPKMKCKDRKGCVAAVVRNTVIVMGGKDERGTCLKSVESFRFDRYSWDELPDMHEARCWATALAF